MRGSAVFRTGVAPGGALAGPWVRNPLWTRARAVPSLDLRFADNKSLVNATTGQNLVTFTRASSGTFVGSDGLIKTAVTNLHIRSEEFGDAAWTVTATEAGVTTDATTAPNGASTADLFKCLTTNDIVRRLVTTTAITVANATAYTASIFIKANSWRYVGLALNANSTNFNTTAGSCTFDLELGTFNNVSALTAQQATQLQNGWWRVSITGTTVTTTATLRISLQDAAEAPNSAAVGVVDAGIYLWGAQLEQSSTVGEYIPTTSTINSAPRFDHNPTTGESLGLLVEEARTNLLLQSQDFTTSWSQTNVTTTPNTTISPDGSTNADTLAINVIAASTSQTTQTFTAGSTITVSVFAKKNTSNFVRFELGSLCSCWFNLDTGVTATNNAGSGTILFSAKSIQSYGNGWYRCVLTVTTSVITALGVSIFATNSDGTTSSIGSSIFLWGAEAEVGAFPTSYIPTTTATVTRAADVASITGSNFSSWYNQTEGTVFGQFLRTASTNTQQGRIFSFNDGTNTNALEIYQTGASNPAAQIIATTGQALWTPSGFTVGTSIKEVLGYKLNNSNASFNGSAETLDTVCNIPTVTQARIGDRQDGVRTLNGTIQRLVYWGQRLPNLQAITQ